MPARYTGAARARSSAAASGTSVRPGNDETGTSHRSAEQARAQTWKAVRTAQPRSTAGPTAAGLRVLAITRPAAGSSRRRPRQDGVLRTVNRLPSPPPPAAVAPAGRLGPTHALILLIAFLALGTVLCREGTPVGDIFALLGGCGAIGAATLAAAGGGRRLVSALVEAAVRSGAGK